MGVYTRNAAATTSGLPDYAAYSVATDILGADKNDISKWLEKNFSGYYKVEEESVYDGYKLMKVGLSEDLAVRVTPDTKYGFNSLEIYYDMSDQVYSVSYIKRNDDTSLLKEYTDKEISVLKNEFGYPYDEVLNETETGTVENAIWLIDKYEVRGGCFLSSSSSSQWFSIGIRR